MIRWAMTALLMVFLPLGCSATNRGPSMDVVGGGRSSSTPTATQPSDAGIIAQQGLLDAVAQLQTQINAAAQLNASLQGAARDLAHIEATAAKLEVAARDINTSIGGGGDSVTAWIYAAIAGAAVLYTLVWRPIRNRLQQGRRQAHSSLMGGGHA